MKNKTIVLNINEQNVFFTSDPHFCHKNIIEYCNRPFKDVDEMNATLIENWNRIITDNDIVFLGGDFCFSGIKTWCYLLDRLNGKKYLTIGNHDKNIPESKFLDIQHRFDIRIIGDEEISFEGQRITVDHYPLISWFQSHRGSWNLHGHVHGGLVNSDITTPNQLDIGVDVHNFTPLSYEDVKLLITKQNLNGVSK